eukprot:CAMPEP_0197534756 /NCGR_PEP_ID=MMETSP1318-20131121/48231_1 /TAXON_ID=552666 /ORGANISM="Partenskyella glossopodia, Strain RCC365" /LENGTH=183 /DNA_ID=CAMNT_0043092137 /DNA_START=93 /DNA_END=641 /DNA_ORIENTATION=-
MNNLKIELEKTKTLIPRYLVPENTRPSYYIHSGFVFTTLTHPYLQTIYGSNWENNPHTPFDFVNVWYDDVPEFVGQQVVVLSHALTSELTSDLEFNNELLRSVNEVKVKNLTHLYQMVETAMAKQSPKFLTFQLGSRNVTIVTDLEKARKEENMILKDNSIPAKASDDLLAVAVYNNNQNRHY